MSTMDPRAVRHILERTKDYYKSQTQSRLFLDIFGNSMPSNTFIDYVLTLTCLRLID